ILDRPGDAGIEYVLIEARARLALGDSVHAQQVVESAISSLQNAGRVLTDEVTSIGALVQLWVLHTAVAGARGNAAAAARSAYIASTLWRDADPAAASVIAGVRSFATPGR
ncbi:MAG: hypothetical protein ABI877_21950, partial [Gemmatimonadaceae bacterium]